MAQNNQTNSPFPTAINKGGTGVTSVTSAPAASAWSGWDANKNASAVGFIPGYTTTVTSASPVTLTVGSNQQQYFTGSTAQTLTMPVANTLVVGQYWTIVNNSSAVVTIQSSGANTILALPANSETVVTCVTASGTSAASWVTSPAVSGSGTVNSGLINQLAWYAAAGTAVSGLATANSGVLVTSAGGVPSISSNLPAGINLPSPFSVNTTSVTSTGTQINLLNGLTVVPINKVITQVFTSSGTYTPTTGMVYCVIECVGGGGGGGGTANSGATASLGVGGGGSGSYARKTSTAASIGASQTVTIGSVGSAGANTGGNGGSGGDTSVGSICIGKGGSGGLGSTNGFTGGAGGVAGTGDFVPVGNAGGSGILTVTTSATAVGGFGAGSYMGGQVAGRTTQGAGTNGSAYGSGGSGAFSTAAGGAAIGGTGALGVVVITEYVSA